MKPAPAEPIINDKLFTLDTALSPAEMTPILDKLARDYFGPDHLIGKVTIEVMRRRNQRCVIRYIAEGRDAAGRPFTWRMVGKVFKANRGERVFAVMRQLWESGFSREMGDGISIPEPIAFSSSLCLLFQEEVPGKPIKSLLKTEPSAMYMRQLARTLAKLHRSPVLVDEVFGVREHLLRCHPRYPFLSLAVPEFEPMIEFITSEALNLESRLQHLKPAPLHGDFHLGQVHLANGAAYLVDLDGLSMGDPASDLGNLLVFLRAKVHRKPETAALIDAFLDEYFSLMDSAIAARIPLYEGLTHLRRACKCLRYQEDGWKRKARKMLEKGMAAIGHFRATTEGPANGAGPSPTQTIFTEAKQND